MSSKVQICNMALSRLGAGTIVSLEDGTPQANLCNTFFNDIARRVMMQGSWSSTIFRVELAKTTNVPAFGYQNEFQLPKNPKSLKVLNIDMSDEGNSNCGTSDSFVIEGDKLLTNAQSVKIKYIGELTNTEDWDTMLTEAVEIALASYLALPITGQAEVADKLRQEYLLFVDNNLAIDGQQGTQFSYWSSDLLEVRL